MMKAVSFMYVRPPGYNAESAKAAELADENKDNATSQDPTATSSSQYDFYFLPCGLTSYQFHFLVSFAYFPILSCLLCRPDAGVDKDQPNKERKARPKDVFGRALPTEQEFEVLKNAPRYCFGCICRFEIQKLFHHLLWLPSPVCCLW
jgi:CBF1 interacting corepressor